MEDIYRASEANAEWNSVYVRKKSTMETSTKPSSWLPPTPGWLKCNFDCSFRNENGTAGLGWIIRDGHGSFILAGMARVNNVSNALQGEALGLLLRCNMCGFGV